MKSTKYILSDVCLILKFNSFLNFYTISYLYLPSLYVYRLQRYVATSVATTNTLIQLEMPHSCRAMHSDMQLTHTVWQALHEIANRHEVVGNAWNLEILQPKLFLALWRPNKPSGRLRSCPLAPPPPTSWESSKANATVPVTTSTTTTTAPSWVKSCETSLQSFHAQLSTQRLCPTAHTAGQPLSVAHPTQYPPPRLSTTNDDVSFRSSSAIRRPQPKPKRSRAEQIRSQLQQLRRWRSLRWTGTIIGVLTVDGCYSHSLAD